MGVTHAFVSENDENGEKTIAGYITLRASSLTMDNDTTIGFRFVVLCADPAAVGFYSKLGFLKIPTYQEIPREHRNKNCVPMMLKIKY